MLTAKRVAHAILRGINLAYSDPQRLDETNRLAFQLHEYLTHLEAAGHRHHADAAIIEELLAAFEADLAAEGGTACPHLHIAVRGNDEVGFQGAHCKDCEEELLRRPAGDGVGYDYRTRDEWEAIDRRNREQTGYAPRSELTLEEVKKLEAMRAQKGRQA